MKKNRTGMVLAIALGLLASVGLTTPSVAEVGAVSVVFTKGGFIVGVGGGQGVLVFRGHRYPFTVSGMSVGFTIGASTTKFVGKAINLRSPGDLAGSYAVGGAGGALRAACFWISFAVGSSSSIFSGMADPSSMTVAPEPIASAGGDIAPLIQIKRSQRGALLNLNRIRLNRSSPGDMKLIGAPDCSSCRNACRPASSGTGRRHMP